VIFLIAFFVIFPGFVGAMGNDSSNRISGLLPLISILFQFFIAIMILYFNFTANGKLHKLEDDIRSIREHDSTEQEHYSTNNPNREGAVQQGLFSAYMLPHPPYNEGRTIRYDTFAKSKDENGREIVVFHEYRDGVYLQTQVPADQIKFSQPE